MSFTSGALLLLQLLLPVSSAKPVDAKHRPPSRAAPRRYLGTSDIAITVVRGDLSHPAIVEPVCFRNAGAAPLHWKFFFGSQIAGCGESTTAYGYAITPDAGILAPRSGTVSGLHVATTGLSAGIYNVVLCIATNDPLAAVTGIPVTVTVKLGAPAR